MEDHLAGLEAGAVLVRGIAAGLDKDGLLITEGVAHGDVVSQVQHAEGRAIAGILAGEAGRTGRGVLAVLEDSTAECGSFRVDHGALPRIRLQAINASDGIVLDRQTAVVRGQHRIATDRHFQVANGRSRAAQSASGRIEAFQVVRSHSLRNGVLVAGTRQEGRNAVQRQAVARVGGAVAVQHQAIQRGVAVGQDRLEHARDFDIRDADERLRSEVPAKLAEVDRGFNARLRPLLGPALVMDSVGEAGRAIVTVSADARGEQTGFNDAFQGGAALLTFNLAVLEKVGQEGVVFHDFISPRPSCSC